MKKTTEDIINLLPIGGDVQEKLLKKLASASPEQRIEVSQLIWDTYDWLYEIYYAKNRDVLLAQVREGKAELTDEASLEVREKTEREMQNLNNQQVDSTQIHELREKIQSLIKAD